MALPSSGWVSLVRFSFTDFGKWDSFLSFVFDVRLDDFVTMFFLVLFDFFMLWSWLFSLLIKWRNFGCTFCAFSFLNDFLWALVTLWRDVKLSSSSYRLAYPSSNSHLGVRHFSSFLIFLFLLEKVMKWQISSIFFMHLHLSVLFLNIGSGKPYSIFVSCNFSNFVYI